MSRELFNSLVTKISTLPQEHRECYQDVLEILKDFNSRLEKLEGKQESKITVVSSNNTISHSLVMTEVPEINEYMETLREWTGKTSFKLLYDSSNDGLIPAAFNCMTSSITNLMTIIITQDNCIFGTYNVFPVPHPPAKGETGYIDKDPDYIVFTLKNPHNIQPTKFTRTRLSHTLRVCPSEGSTVVAAADCFQIETNNSYIIPSFGGYHNPKTAKGSDIFVGNHYPARFVVKKMVAVQWV